MTRQALAFAAAMILPILAQCAPAATELQFWHSMSGSSGDQVGKLAVRFNASQRKYRVIPVFKGGYEDTLSAAVAALHTRTAPHIIQIFDSETSTMMAAREALMPLYRLMAETGEKFDARAYMPAVSSHYADGRGRLLSLPFNSSTAVLFYNKDVFRKAGIDPAATLKTWPDVQVAAQKVRDSDAAPCAYTTDWQSWVLVENMSALHNEPLATRNNGFGGAGAKLNFNGALLLRHIGLMSAWVKSGLFTYAGRKSEGRAKFATGECAMVTAASSAYAGLAKSARFAFAVSPLPYYDESRGAPYNTIVRGASLWVLAGKRQSEYQGVAKFFSFLTRPEIQAEWDTHTGYLPNTLAAYALIRTQGYYARDPGAEVAVKQMNGKPRAHSRGARLAQFARIRSVVDEELEAVWSQTKTPKEALDSAVARGNELMRRFERGGKR